MTRRFAIAGHAASVVEMYAEEVDGWDEDDNVKTVVESFRAGGPYTSPDQRRVLVVDKARALDVADGLCDLLNGEDDMADANARTNPELAAMNRAGARGLRTIRNAVIDWAAR